MGSRTRGRGAGRGAARRRRGGVHGARRRAQPGADADGAGPRAQPRDRRGGRPGHLARGDQRDRPVRGPLGAAHLDLPDPAQQGADPRQAREAHPAVLVLPPARRGGRATSRRSTPTVSRAATVSAPAGGRARRSSGRGPRRGSRTTRPATCCWRRSPSCRRASARCSCSATSWATAPRRRATLSTSSETNQRVLLHRAARRSEPRSSEHFERRPWGHDERGTHETR